MLANDHVSEEHCYFPEWADRPPATGSLHEVDWNSYLAGGYAEEFGHRVQSVPVPPAPIPAGAGGERRGQIGCLHSGYPECPRPVDREPQADRGRAAPQGWPPPRQPRLPGREPAFRVILIGHGEGSRPRPRHRAWSLWREFRIRRLRLPLS